MKMKHKNFLVAWYDWANNQHEWRVAENKVQLLEMVSAAAKVCDSSFGVMIFDMDNVLNEDREIPEELEAVFPKVIEISMKKFDGDFNCHCGNNSMDDGFFPSDKEGNEMEPVAGNYSTIPKAWEGHFVCNTCRQVYLPKEEE